MTRDKFLRRLEEGLAEAKFEYGKDHTFQLETYQLSIVMAEAARTVDELGGQITLGKPAWVLSERLARMVCAARREPAEELLHPPTTPQMAVSMTVDDIPPETRWQSYYDVIRGVVVTALTGVTTIEEDE